MKISSYKPLIVAVFLVLGGFALRSTSPSKAGLVEVTNTAENSVPGSAISSIAHSQILVGVAEGAQMANSAVVVQNAGTIAGSLNGPGGNSGAPYDENNVGSAYQVAAFQDPGQPIGTSISGTASIKYTIAKGDTLSSVAAQFNVSADSIVNANPNLSKKKLRSGQTITIPGVVIPSTSTPALPDFSGNFVLPAQGYDVGVLQGDGSVEIQNSCGTPVVAAADGIVVPDSNVQNTANGWNDGYGTILLIEHPFGNGVYTRYTHLDQTQVGVGSYVKQGQQIGTIGQTGNTTACRLGFQVIGAQNPFVK